MAPLVAVPAQQVSGPFAGSEKKMADMRAAGFSVADPSVHWGVTIVVDAEQTTGGFSAETEENLITLHWAKVPQATNFEIFRSIHPVIPLLMETTRTMETGGNSADAQTNHWPDNQVVANTRYYYAVLGITSSHGCSLVATGSAVATPQPQPQTDLQGGGPNHDSEQVTKSPTYFESAEPLDIEAAKGAAVTQETAIESQALAPWLTTVWDLAIAEDGRHIAVTNRSDDKVTVTFDGRDEKSYADIGRGSLCLSPDGRHLAYVAKKGRNWVVVEDGLEGTEYEEIGPTMGFPPEPNSPVFSPDGNHLAYQAKKGPNWLVVLDGHEGPPFNQIGIDMEKVLFSPDSQHLAYAAKRSQSWLVVMDGREGKAYEDIAQRSLAFSPDSKHLVYQATLGNPRIVMDGQDGTAYPRSIGPVIFSPDGKHYAYAAHVSVQNHGPVMVNTDVVVVDGKQGREYNYIDELSLVFSPDSKHLAYPASRGDKGFAVVDGQEGPPYSGVNFKSIRFSPDGKRMAYYAAKGQSGDVWVAVIDGQEGKVYNDCGERSLVFSPDSKRVAYSALLGDRWVMVVDGKQSREYEDPMGFEGPPAEFSPDSKHVAYEGRDGSSDFVMVDGHQHVGFGQVVFSPDSKHVAYREQRGQQVLMVLDGHEGPPYDKILSVIFDSNGVLEYFAVSDHTVYRVRQAIHKFPSSR